MLLSGRGLPALRRVLVVSGSVGLVVLVGLHVLNRGTPVDTWGLGNTVLGFGLGLTGALLTARFPGNPIGWIFLVGGVGQSLCGASREWAIYAALTDPGSLPAPEWAAWASGWLQQIGLATLPLVLLHFPDGRLVSSGWRHVRRLVVVVMGATLVLSAVQPGRFEPDVPLTNPMGIDAIPGDALWPALSAATVLVVLLAAVSLLVRWRRSDVEDRQRMRWVTASAGLLAAEVVFEMTVNLGSIQHYTASIALLLFVGTIGYAVLRHHLWDLDVLVNVSVVCTVLTAVALGIVMLSAVVVDAIVGSASVWPVAGAILLVILLFRPLRHGIQSATDRVLYGRRPDPHRTLAGLGRRVGSTGAAEPVLAEAVDAIAAAFLRLDHVAIRTADGVVSRGTARAELVGLPIVFRGTQIGRLEVAARPGAALRGKPLAQMHELADEVAPLVHAVILREAVDQLRRELASAREEERRRLRRDIHDGIGPALAAVALQVDGAATLVDSCPEVVKEVLLRVAGQVGDVLADIRRLVHELRPPVLDALGLSAAVAQLATTFAIPSAAKSPGLLVTVDTPDSLGKLPAAVEVTAYRVVAEALSNVARHSGAGTATVVLARGPGLLRVVVEDDGVGPPPDGPYGVGTISMIERATAIGGDCTIGSSATGGVRVSALLPLGDGPARDEEVS
ncbi:hypothetical protein GCM10011492_14090 [Flexivirga endophytica]|uniref:histidine kinase n=1 Tax=Flexivirga endophytica TaxID=1849103 RepID=A0A916SZK9_9MICO|nr:histidine kinase [Flexivirga endophytica]GGB25236.1 hypothetical protein GCM10011492_14090 [Flexivirga endophytica]GHB53810.1 hypothetical protein GCM10008112_23410 [Flexivirga endophytica]